MKDFIVSQHDNSITLAFASSFAHVDQAIATLLAFLGDRGVTVKAFDMNLILREGLNNAVEHGNGCDLSRSVQCAMEVKQDNVHITIEDEGEGFDWQHRDVGAIDARSERGKGLLLMQAYGFLVTYNSKGNIMNLYKALV